MHVGADYHVVEGDNIVSRENLEYNLRFGVKHISPDPDMVLEGAGRVSRPHGSSDASGGAFIAAEGPSGGAFDLDKLKRMKDACDAAGMTIEGFRMDSGYIVMKPGPERERKLDQIMENIRKTSMVEVGLISQHWTMIPIRRNGKEPGRGGSTYTTFKLEDNWRDLPPGIAGHITSEEYWERITTFLQRVIPVCKEYNVRMANHPYDPPGLPLGYEGVENFDSPSIFTAYKRYEKIVDSPYNGFQLDLGVLAEGCTDANRQIPPLVQYLAGRGKIHQIHMRAIRGGLNNFAEVYPDEGVLDLFRIMRILRDSGYLGGILPDHMPAHPGDPGKLQAYAFGYGYIHALINGVNSEVT
ncbi:MAG TPA: mannonate dehydratase [Acidobacteriaceae bacterium]|nr:mannonate dehydratase [Acidobacteriaceae bacterium]